MTGDGSVAGVIAAPRPSQAERALSPQPYNYCPYASTTLAVPSGRVMPGANSVLMEIKMLPAPCMGPDCQLWSERRACCSQKPDEGRLQAAIAVSIMQNLEAAGVQIPAAVKIQLKGSGDAPV